MADINWDKFAKAVEAELRKRDLSYDAAVTEWPDLNKGLLSRAVNAKPLSAGNYLHLCRLLWLKPDRYLIAKKRPRVTLTDILKAHENQAVTLPVTRETARSARV